MRILFVEKDVTAADLLVPSLERKGYQVAVASTQRQVSSRVRTARPDLAVVDVVSFGSNGYKMLDAVRARIEGVPTILLLEKGHESVGSTADAFMTPPFTSRKLLYRVRQVAECLTPREIHVGSLTLELDARVLIREDERVQLRPKEADLLAFFMSNPGRVLSRAEIMKKVWDTDYLGDTRTLSVHVRWIRTKIEENPNKPRLLRTVRGLGYRFQNPDPPDEVPPASKTS
ncbi:MAG: response regulator transcription factor [Anaerolineae bacterium]|nr:response regulator transcription factor [Anaerolineae bacterium]